MSRTTAFDWRTIGALNAVSTLAQIGQFGIAFVVLPVWLAAQGMGATQLGMFAASLWLGQLPGLGLAPWLCRRMGPRWVIVAGLLCTAMGLPCIALTTWPYCLPGGMLCGFGLGLRWIGVEPWLYRIAPAEARGRLVGFHETLIAVAPIVAPVLAGTFGLQGFAVFWVGAGFVLAALIPLLITRIPTHEGDDLPLSNARAPLRDPVFKIGLVIALLGGMLMQYGVGWLADHRGVAAAATACAAGIVLVALGLVLPLNYPQQVVAVFFLGGFVTALLTLALIASTTASAGSMAGNVSTISILYTASAVAGPLLAGAAMQATHSDALMWCTAVAALVMACWIAPALVRRVPPVRPR